jgi:5'-3' exonuclease
MSKAIIDGNFFLTRFCYSPNIQHDYDPLFYFLKSMWELRELGDAIVVFDGKRPDFRLDLYPEYKKKPFKIRTDKEIAKSENVERLKDLNMAAIKQVLPLMGIPVIQHPDWEADDQIYRLGQHFRKFGSVTAVSSDSDFFQMAREGITIHRPYHNETIDRISFYQKFDFDVDFYTLYLSLVGTHNAVKGVHGIGDIRASEIMKELNEPSVKALKKWTRGNKSGVALKIKKQFGIVKRNMELVDLDRVPLTQYEMYVEYQKAIEKCNFNHVLFVRKTKEYGVSNCAKWVPFLMKQRQKRANV